MFRAVVSADTTRGAGAPPSLRRSEDHPVPDLEDHNEGRRRPSLIAAHSCLCASVSSLAQRGAPAPLPHCGISLEIHSCLCSEQRGAPAPLPHCGSDFLAVVLLVCLATRGAGAPPSLRLCVWYWSVRPRVSNEGRRRPSLIAALPGCPAYQSASPQRGAPAPLPHCGLAAQAAGGNSTMQRGAPAPLPHCGPHILAVPPLLHHQRGAPAPLPHCGNAWACASVIVQASTRGAGAPPSLRHYQAAQDDPADPPNEGRRRPSLIAAGVKRMGGVIAPRATRGAGAPPSLRPVLTRRRMRAFCPTRGAGAPPSLRPLPFFLGCLSGWAVASS